MLLFCALRWLAAFSLFEFVANASSLGADEFGLRSVAAEWNWSKVGWPESARRLDLLTCRRRVVDEPGAMRTGQFGGLDWAASSLLGLNLTPAFYTI